jgi:hypothetical protein
MPARGETLTRSNPYLLGFIPQLSKGNKPLRWLKDSRLDKKIKSFLKKVLFGQKRNKNI